MPTSILKNFEDIDNLRIEMETHFGPLHKEIREDERYIELKIRDLLNIPANFVRDAVVLPTAREVIDTATDHITPKFRRVLVPRRNTETADGTAQALKLRRFYEALLNWTEDQFTISPFRMGVKHLAGVGISCWRLDFDKKRHPGRPSRNQFDNEDDFNDAMIEWRQIRSENLPFALRILHPTEVFFDPLHDPPEWFIQRANMPVYDIERMYPHWENKAGLSRNNKAEVLEYFDAHVRAISINKEPGLKTKDGSGILHHKWGMHPLIVGGSGLGYDNMTKALDVKYSGFIRIIRDVLKSESRNYSIADIVMKSGAWPIRTATGEQAAQVAAIDLTDFGKIHQIPEGVELGSLESQLPPQMIFSFLQMTNSIISGATAPRVARGLQQPGLRSGFDRQVALGQSTLRYQPLADSTERMMSMMLRNAGFLMERVIKEPISIAIGAQQDEFLRVSGNDFKGHHAVKVKINILETSDEVRKMQNVLQMVTGGLMSPQTAIRENLELQEILAGILGSLGGGEGGQQQGRLPPSDVSGGAQAGDRSDQAQQRTADGRNTGV